MLLKKYAIEIADLKRELAMHDALASRTHRVEYEPYSDAQRLKLMEELQAFLSAEDDVGGDSDIPLESVRQMRELLTAMKSLYSKQAAELDRVQKMLASVSSSAAATRDGRRGRRGRHRRRGRRRRRRRRRRGRPERQARHRHRPRGGRRRAAGRAGGAAGVPALFTGEGEEEGGEALATSGVQDGAVLGRSEAYVQFKMNEGRIENERLLAAKRQMKEASEAPRARGVGGLAKRSSTPSNSSRRRRSTAAARGQPGGGGDHRRGGVRLHPDLTRRKVAGDHGDARRGDTVAAAASSVDRRAWSCSRCSRWYATVHNEEPEPLVPKFDELPPPTADVMDNDEQFEQRDGAGDGGGARSLAFVRARRR